MSEEKKAEFQLIHIPEKNPCVEIDPVLMAMNTLSGTINRLEEHLDYCHNCQRDKSGELKLLCFRGSALALYKMEAEERVLEAKSKRPGEEGDVERLREFFKFHSDPVYKCIRPQ